MGLPRRGIREVMHPLLRGQVTLPVLVAQHCKDEPNAINDESLQVGHIIDVVHP